MSRLNVALAVCLIVATSLASWFYYQASSLNAVNASLRKEFQLREELYQLEISKAQTALQTQNEAIEIYQADLDSIRASISRKSRELTELKQKKEAELLNELLLDSSSDNQLLLMDRILHDFTK